MKHRYGGGSKSKSKGARLRPYIVLLYDPVKIK